MAVVSVDTSVLIAALDDRDLHHAAALRALSQARQDADIVISSVAFAETLVGPYRKSDAAGQDIEHKLTKLGAIESVTPQIARRAAQLRAQHTLKLPDAFIIATGIELRTREILTFDQDWFKLELPVRCLMP